MEQCLLLASLIAIVLHLTSAHMFNDWVARRLLTYQKSALFVKEKAIRVAKTIYATQEMLSEAEALGGDG